MPFLVVDGGVSIYAQDVGDGPPVVLLAGLGLNHAAWDRQVRVLAARHRVVCIDLRGTGRSDKPIAGYEVERLAEDVRAALEQLAVRDATLIGWSFGGQVALHLAVLTPALVARLGLVASAGVRASRSDRFPFGLPAHALESALISGEEADRIAFRRRTIASGFCEPPNPELLDWLLRCQLEMPSWAAVALYRSYLRSDLIDALPELRQPVLLVSGRDDPVTSPEAMRWVCSRLAEAVLLELERCGHYPLFEAAPELDRALLDFAER